MGNDHREGILIHRVLLLRLFNILQTIIPPNELPLPLTLTTQSKPRQDARSVYVDVLNTPQGLAGLDQLDRAPFLKSLTAGWILRKRA